MGLTNSLKCTTLAYVSKLTKLTKFKLAYVRLLRSLKRSSSLTTFTKLTKFTRDLLSNVSLIISLTLDLVAFVMRLTLLGTILVLWGLCWPMRAVIRQHLEEKP